jgi:tetratricopeptide (TPR) repeat protein
LELEYKLPIKITYLHHHEDNNVRKELRKHLVYLEREGFIEEILEVRAGASREEEKRRLEAAQIIIPLISSNFASETPYEQPEMEVLVQKRFEEHALIWPILVKSFSWARSPYYKYGAFLEKDKEREAITDYSPQDDAYTLIAEKAEREILQLLTEQWVQDGNNYYHQMRLEEAIKAYNNSLHYTPDYPLAFFGKWRVFRKMNKPEEAEQAFHALHPQRVSIPPKGKDAPSPDSLITSLLRSLCKGRAYLDLGELGKALLAFQEVHQQIPFLTNRLKQKKLYAEICCSEGDAFLQQGHQAPDFAVYYDQAIYTYQKAVERFPNNVTYLTRLAKAWIIKGCRLQANDCYEQALKIYQQLLPSYNGASVSTGEKMASSCLCQLKEALLKYGEQLTANGSELDISGEKGIILLTLKNAQEALSAFDHALFWEDNNAYYHYGKGQALALLEHYQEAFESYQRACDRKLYRSADFFIHYAAVLLALERYEEARDLYQKALYQGGDKSTCYVGLGKIACADDGISRETVMRYCEFAIRFAPDRAEPYLERGKAYAKFGAYGKAFADFNHASDLCRDPESTIDLADIKTACGDAWSHFAAQTDSQQRDNSLETACVLYNEAIDIRKHADAYLGLGKAHTDLERFAEAIKAFEQAQKLKPQLPAEYYFLEGNCHNALRKYEEAYGMYKAAVSCDPNNFDYLKALADISLMLQKYREAEKLFDGIIKHNTDSGIVAYAYCGKGTALHGQKKHEEAVQCFMKANQLDHKMCSQPPCKRVLEDIQFSLDSRPYPDTQTAFTHRCRGDALMLLKGDSEAINAYTTAIEYGERSADTYYWRGKVYAKSGEYQQALNDYEEALHINQHHQLAQQAKEEVISKIALSQKGAKRKPASWLKLSW